MVRAAQKGEAKTTSPEVARTAASIKMKDAKKFASTKHKGLPEKKMKKESVSEDAKMRRQSDEKLAAAHKKFSSMDQSPANSFMKKRIEKEINRRKKTVKEAAELKKAKINYKTTKKGGKTTYHVNKNDEADAQKAMKNDPKYILGKTRVKPVKEEGEAYHTMSTREFNKTHRDFKSGSKKKGNARVTKGVNNVSGGTTPVSRRVKFTDEYIHELDLKKIGKKIVNKAKEVWNRPVMKDYPTKKQHLDKIRSQGGDPSHWESVQQEGAFTTGAALTAAGLAAWKFSQGMKARNQMKKSIETPGTNLNKIKQATDQKNKLLQQLNQSYEPQGDVVEAKDNCGCGKNPCETYGEAKEIPKNVKKIAKELDKAVAMHKDQAKRLRAAGVSEGFYQKRYAGVGKGYETVGKNKRMDKSNKRSGDSKKQYRELHQDLAKKEETILEKKKMVRIKVTRPIKTKVTDVGAGGKEYVRKDWSEENLTEIKFSFRKTSKPKTERKPQKAQDAGARGRRLLQRREYARTISGSEDRVPDDLRDSVQYEESCGKGEYYCHDEQKCKPIPEGHKVEKGGNLVKETSVALKFGTSGTDLNIGGRSVKNTIKNVKTTVSAIKNIRKDGFVDGLKNTFNKPKVEKPSIASNIDKAIKNYNQQREDTQHLLNIKNAIKTKTMNGKPLTDKQIEGLKAGLTQGNWRQDGSKRGMEEGAAWTRKAGKNKSGGLNEKGRKSYERENPGSDLKAPSKKKGNKRRASFCARMKGMKKKLTSKKTARDPNSRINKSLRAWNCSYEPETPMLPEATRLKKEKGYDKGGTKKPTGGKNKDEALNAVLSNIRAKHGKGAIMRKGSNQQKKVKGQKSTSGTGKYLAKHKEKQQLKKDAKEMGYGKDTKGYVETRARYGSKENMKSGKGLGT